MIDNAALKTEWGIEAVDVTAYLARVGYRGEVRPDAATLHELHVAHLTSIPFENIDVILGRTLGLAPAEIQEKLVRRARGGWCHEHNLLFAAVLERIGFCVSRRLARTRDDGQILLPRAHSTLVVQADGGPWLADVGFGGEGPLEPIRLVDGVTSVQGGWTYRLSRRDEGWALALDGARPPVLYTFDEGSYRAPDFLAANHFVATHPSSPFLTDLVVSRTTAEARFRLHRRELTVESADGTQTRRELDVAELPDLLAGTFGIMLTAAELDAVRSCDAAGTPQ